MSEAMQGILVDKDLIGFGRCVMEVCLGPSLRTIDLQWTFELNSCWIFLQIASSQT